MLPCGKARLVLCCVGAVLLLVPACKENEVVATLTCGDGVCSADEDETNCFEDCGPPCGDDLCESGETALSCPVDCAGPLYPGPCSALAVPHGAGSGSASYLFEYEAVEDGVRVTYVTDDYSDGVVDYITYTTFDAGGNNLSWEADSDADGLLDGGEFRTLDSDGRCSQSESYFGDLDVLVALTTHEYDADGYLSHTFRDCLEGSDPNCFDTDSLYDWSADHTSCTKNSDVVGSVDRVDVYTYDATGRMTSFENWGNDDVLDQRCEYIYGEGTLEQVPGALVLHNYLDTLAARVLEIRCYDRGYGDDAWIYSWDEHGNLLQREFYRYDVQAEPLSTQTFSYDCWQQ